MSDEARSLPEADANEEEGSLSETEELSHLNHRWAIELAPPERTPGFRGAVTRWIARAVLRVLRPALSSYLLEEREWLENLVRLQNRMTRRVDALTRQIEERAADGRNATEAPSSREVLVVAPEEVRTPDEAPAEASSDHVIATIEDRFEARAPGPQNAVDLFRGLWKSRFPEPFRDLDAGKLGLFEDPRIAWGLKALGGCQGLDVLELGPLEGAHTTMLERAGARSVLGVEANRAAFLRCLVTKEILGLSRARFVCGDALEYLRTTEDRFGLCVASGILYHMVDPCRLVSHLARIADRVLIWTHYYDEEIVRSRPNLSRMFPSAHEASLDGFRHTLHRYEYLMGFDTADFSGGTQRHSHWLSRDDLLRAFEHFGFTEVEVGPEDRAYEHGPHLVLAARTPSR